MSTGPIVRVPSVAMQQQWTPQQWWTLHANIDQALLDMQFRAAVAAKERT